MANQHDIKKYLIENENSYLNNSDSNGKILMLSGVWGSGKTYFWKEKIEKKEDFFKNLKDKSYVYISLYGKDSIEELQNEIQQLSYNFSKNNTKDIISSTFSVFTKVASFMPKISFNAYGMGVKVDPEKTVEKLEEENIKQQIEKGVGRLKDGGIICFDDFERKSSKIDLNDLFGFITNLTEVFQTKTIIITNQEFFKENDSEVFSRIKEKSINKFLLFNPTVDELFETIYEKKKYSALDEYKSEILKAIKITEEKNARIFIQVLDNCLEYKKNAKNEHEIFMLVLISVLFVKYNLVFRMENIKIRVSIGSKDKFLPNIVNSIPAPLISAIDFYLDSNLIQAKFIYELRAAIEETKKEQKEENLKEDFKYIEKNQDMLYQVYKYSIKNNYFKEEDKNLIEKLNNFVESGILLTEEVADA
ncbi:MAG: hypothetical protein DRG78_24820 [Epsilonproteobacteria bacterium]|nr:MAG: hypothetical protein DRG78_24820 [Campylobacterota bacterium]